MSHPTPLAPAMTSGTAEFPVDGKSSTEPPGTTNTRVLHLINGEHYSGAERVQDLLAARLPELGFDVGFACVKPGRFPEMRVTHTARLYEVPMRSKFDIRAIGQLAAIVREEDYRLLHAHTPRTVLVGSLLARRTGLPLVYHVHSPACRDSTARWRNWINAATERFSLRVASQLITVSHSLAETMRRQGFASRLISVVPNGVPHTVQGRSNDAPADTWTLGAVALFRPRKGTEVLLDALAQLRQQGHDVRLLAVGPFETEAYGRSLLAETQRRGLTEHVEWTGFTRDVNTQLQRMDLFVLPSLFGEGLPMVVLEAMAAGVPVVGTQVEGVPEAIRDGIDGVLAVPGDSQDLARSIRRVITGSVDWSTLRTHAAQRHHERFSDISMATGVATAYRKLQVCTNA